MDKQEIQDKIKNLSIDQMDYLVKLVTMDTDSPEYHAEMAELRKRLGMPEPKDYSLPEDATEKERMLKMIEMLRDMRALMLDNARLRLERDHVHPPRSFEHLDRYIAMIEQHIKDLDAKMDISG